MSERSNALWALIDQVISSATNFGGAVLAARVLGIEAFGAFGIAFAVYLLALGVSRAVSVDPLVIRHSASPLTTQRQQSGRAAGSAIGVAIIGALGCALASLIIQGQVGGALLALSVTLPFLLIQDAWRFALIMTLRARAAAINDTIWLVGTLTAFVVIDVGPSAAAFATLAWASGAVIAAFVGAAQVRAMPDVRALSWWREHSDLGPRYIGEFAATVGVTYMLMLVVAGIGGAADTAGIRGAQVLFGPMNVLLMGVATLSLPIQVRRLHSSSGHQLRLPVAVSVVCTASVIGWFLVVVLLPGSVGTALLGASWSTSKAIAPFIAWSMAASAVIAGPLIALRASARSRESFRLRVLIAPGALAAGTVGVILAGPAGAIAAAAMVNTLAAPWWWRAARNGAHHLDRTPSGSFGATAT